MGFNIWLMFDSDNVEKCLVIKKYGNGDYQLDRRGARRLEVQSRYLEEYIDYPPGEGEPARWVPAYLKGSKMSELVVVQRTE